MTGNIYEMANLTVADVHLDSDYFLVKKAKGQKVRAIVLTPNAKKGLWR